MLESVDIIIVDW